MSWEYARAGLHCHACYQPVTEGDLVRRGDVARMNVWCQLCSRERLQESPPDDVPLRARMPQGKLAMPESLTRKSLSFQRDVSARILGERDE